MIYSNNEWDNLKSIVVGTATNAHWPTNCEKFRTMEETTLWKDTPLPKGKVPQHIIEETNEDLELFVSVLKNLNVTVFRPDDMDFESFDGMYNYCPRDRVLIVGDKVINCPMTYPTRMPEIQALEKIIGKNYISCDIAGPSFDAANVCRLGKDLLYLVSSSGNIEGAHWLQEVLGNQHTVHILDNIYSGVHIDSTILPLREGLVLLNAERINENNLPDIFKNWEKIWIGKEEIQHKDFYEYPYASNFIGMNFLSVSEDLVILDPNQTSLINKLQKHKINCIGVDLRHSRTLGGGHHCTTLDIERS